MRSGPRDPRPHLSPSSCSLLSRPDACFQFLTKLCCLPRGPGGLKLRMGMSPHCGALGPCGLSWAPGGTGPAQPWLWSRCHWRRSCSGCGLGGQLGVAAGALGLSAQLSIDRTPRPSPGVLLCTPACPPLFLLAGHLCVEATSTGTDLVHYVLSSLWAWVRAGALVEGGVRACWRVGSRGMHGGWPAPSRCRWSQ